MKSGKARLILCWAAALASAVWGFLFLPGYFRGIDLASRRGLMTLYCANAVQQIIAFALPSLLILAARPRRWRAFRQSLRPVGLPMLSGCLLLAVGGTVTVSLIAMVWGHFLYSAAGYAGTQELLPMPDSPGEWMLSMAAVALLPAACEELLFRALLQTALRKRLPRTGIWLTALIFAALHFRWEAFPALILVGLVLGMTYIRYGYIGSLALHALYNAVTLILSVGAVGVTPLMLLACCAACWGALRLLFGKERSDETDGAGL